MKRVINRDHLTLVPKKGRMIDTKKYIRDNLQAYADNKYFAFSKPPRNGVKSVAPSPERVREKRTRNRNNIMTGMTLPKLESLHFLSQSAVH